MFVRISETKTKYGKTYKYLKLVSGYRDKTGKVHQKVISLGRIDLIKGKLDKLVRQLRKYCANKFVLPNEVKADTISMWGPLLLARALWEKTGMDSVIDRLLLQKDKEIKDLIFLLVANRMHDPKSEHGLARWLDKVYACFRGERILPEWEDERKITKEKRVKVKWGQLKKWYKACDILYSFKEEIEKELYFKFRDLFSLKVDIIFYDTTSTYFEVMERKGDLRCHGYSRDEKRRNVQVVVGIAVANGFPISHHVFEGNKLDFETVKQVIEDMDRKFGVRKVIFVGDRGMVSPENIEFLKELNYNYIFGSCRRGSKEVKEYLNRLEEEWKKIDEKTKYQEIKLEGKRVFMVFSEERKNYEKGIREFYIGKCKEEFERLRRRVLKGKVKRTDKIAACAERVMQRYKGYRYFRYEVSKDGDFRYYEDEEKMRYEKGIEGLYILETNDEKLSGYEVISAYKQLREVENFFRELKDNLGIRPNWHKREDRIKAHIFISYLALVMVSVLRHILREEGVLLSARDAINAVESIGIAEIDFIGEKKKLVSGGSRDARRVTRALKIKDFEP